MTESYLDMMADSLRKKIRILQELERLSVEQKEFFAQGSGMDDDAFNASVERKGVLIDSLEKLDDGFTALFDHVKQEIGTHREQYAAEIRGIQDQIRTISALSSAIEAQEKRNKAAADKYFAEAREELQQGKKTSGTAMLYYQTMNKTQNVTPQYFDSKN